MKDKLKILYKILIIMIIFVVITTFYNIFINHNYKIYFKLPCDPKIENCFVLECDSTLIENCSSIYPEYYKLVERKAFNVIQCSDGDFDCLSCKNDEKDCVTTFCDPSQEGNVCSDNQYDL